MFDDRTYARLATISVAHLYNLRASAGYRRQRGHHEPTRARSVAIGERRRPQPNGQSGYLRVDSVHQDDWDGAKGLYVINLVDAVTQFEVVVAVERISEKSRVRRTNDNALVESKNAPVVRKHLGYSHIPSHHAKIVNDSLCDYLTPYLNYHRPCFFPEVTLDDKGRQRRRYHYKHMNTPYEKLKALPKADTFLKPGITFAGLDILAHALTDNQAAEQLNHVRKKLFQCIKSKKAA